MQAKPPRAEPAVQSQPALDAVQATPADPTPLAGILASPAAPPLSETAAAVECVPPTPKSPARPASLSKAKPVHKEPPSALPTAPVVADAPPGGVIASEVRSMPVSVMSILGSKVHGPQGEDLGRVVDVLADGSGRVRTAIIDFGGFLGVGDRRIAVDWPLLRFSPADPASVVLSVGRDKLLSVPNFRGAPRPEVLMVSPILSAPAGGGKQ